MSGILDFARRFARNRAALAALVLLVAIVLTALIGPMLYPTDPFEMIGRPSVPPGRRYLLGTNVSGRDILAGLIHGARVSLLIGLLASLGATAFGLIVGALAGYYGKLLDTLLMRCTDFFLTIPSFVLAVVLIAIFRPSVFSVTASIAVVSWPPIARLARAEFIAHRDREYVQACRALGMSDIEIIVRQIPPQCAPARHRRVLTAGGDGHSDGIRSLVPWTRPTPNVVSWGYMIGVGRTVLRTAWWMPATPASSILITVLCINLVGEGLNDALNPRLQRR